MKNNLLLILLSIIGIWGCESETIDKDLIGPSYFPLDTGTYKIFERTNINHDAFLSQSDTVTYLQKETVLEILMDTVGTPKYKVLVENSTDSGVTWEFNRFVVLSINLYSALRTEEDITKVKLSFPILERKSWDANIYNTEDFQRVRFRNVGAAYSSEYYDFAESVEVDLENNEDPFFTNIEHEIYANNIGLVERRLQDLERQPDKYLQGKEYVKILKETNLP